MSRAVRIYEQWRAAEGRPVPRRLSIRDQAKKLREQAAELLATAAELDEAADAAGEPK